MRRLFVVICLLILYGSLYPWHANFGRSSLPDAISRVVHSWPPSYPADILQDAALNIVVYVPLGLIGYLAGRSGFSFLGVAWPICGGPFG